MDKEGTYTNGLEDKNMMTMHKVLHLRHDIDRLYVKKKEGERGLANIEHSVDALIQGLDDYIKKKD